MEIRKTKIEELDKVMEIYAYARQFMEEHGNPNQWKKTNPPKERVEQDIKEEKSYVYNLVSGSYVCSGKCGKRAVEGVGSYLGNRK